MSPGSLSSMRSSVKYQSCFTPKKKFPQGWGGGLRRKEVNLLTSKAVSKRKDGRDVWSAQLRDECCQHKLSVAPSRQTAVAAERQSYLQA